MEVDRTSWFPKPPVKPPPRPPTMWALFAGVLLPVVGVAALVIALSTSHSGKTNTTKTRTEPASASGDPRAAFEQCLRNSGVGSGSRGRLGGPSAQYREAIAVCGSLTRQRPGAVPIVPAPAQTAPNVA